MPNLLDSLSINEIKSLFPHTFYMRGEAYYYEGRVKHVAQTLATDKAITFRADVKGTRTYSITIQLEKLGQHVHLQGHCTCPIAYNCKHVIAVILDILAKRDVTGKPLVTVAQEEPATCFYLLSMGTNTALQLLLTYMVRRRLKSGHWQTKLFTSSIPETIQKQLAIQDTLLIEKINQTQKNVDNAILLDQAGEALLLEILATQRAIWGEQRESNKGPIAQGLPRQATFIWDIDQDGFQSLHCYAEDHSVSLFWLDPLNQSWYYDSQTNEMGLLHTSLTRHTLQSFLAMPKLAPHAAKDIIALIDREKLLLPKPHLFTKIETITVTPVPILTLSKAMLSTPASYVSSWLPSSGEEAVAKLSFNYAGHYLAEEDKRQQLFLPKNDALFEVTRDFTFEARAKDLLMTYHLFPMSARPDLIRANPTYQHYFLLTGAEDEHLDFMVHKVPLLRKAGWEVEIAADYPYRVIEGDIDEWYTDIDESSGYDWFGVALGISVKGEKINLLPILQQLLTQLKVEEKIITDEKEVSVKLADGRYIFLPKDRVQAIINIFVELYDADVLSPGQSLKLSRLQAVRLLEVEKAFAATRLRWVGGEKIRNFAKKLQTMQRPTPVKMPTLFQGTLRPYQQEGVSWMQFLRECGLSGILADDMGLGKTVQTLCHLAIEKEAGRLQMPSLIIAPTSLMYNWQMEANRFCPTLKCLILHGKDRIKNFPNIHHYDLVFSTYPLLHRDKNFFLNQPFYYLILDEAQNIKNAKSLMTQVAMQIKATHRFCLTGTPMENHLGELWSLFHFMLPGLLGDEKAFNRLFKIPIERLHNNDRRLHLQNRIAPFMLRRTKDKVVKELPAKVEVLQNVVLSDGQRDLYETVRLSMQQKVRAEIARLGLKRSQLVILDALLKLRQICCDPRLLKMATKKNAALSAKLDLLMTLLPDLLEDGRRILLFSQFTEMLALIEAELNKQKIPYVILTGQTRDRVTPIQAFQTGKVPLFLISLKAGGTGLNLTQADTVIHYDPWWNPAVENQATDRAHRIGQDKTVFVYKLITQGTVEEKILAMQKNKEALFKGLFLDNKGEDVALSALDWEALFGAIE